MDPLACVDLPAFPLQLLLKLHPEWAAYPAAVVAEDKPQGMVLWVNEKARELGVLPGLRYGAALSLASGLRAGEVAPAEIKKATAALARQLMRFTPEVEPSAGEPGVFWLNGRGLNFLYSSRGKWADKIHSGIATEGFQASVVAGFTRFGTYAVARAKKGITVFSDLSEEKRAAQKVSLDRLDLEPEFRDALWKLGIKTVGGLLSLPPGGLRERFGPKAHRLYRMAAGDLWTPLDPYKTEEPVRQKLILDDPEGDAERLLFLIKQLLHPLLAALAAQAQALAALSLSFLVDNPYKNLPPALRLSSGRTAQPLNHDVFHPVRGEPGRTMNGIDRSGRLKEQIRPAVPTLDSVQILDLVRLRLESMRLSAGIMEIELTAEGCAATVEQLRLFAERPARDLDAANRALARLRAEFGDKAVVRAKLADGHLPEARFTWEPLSRIQLPRNDLSDLNRPTAKVEPRGQSPWHPLSLPAGRNPERRPTAQGRGPSRRVLVRRVMAKPTLLHCGPYHSHEDGWLVLGPKYGAVDKLTGPYVFSGGWWHREIQRDYYFAETRRGDILWLYYDRVRRRWCLQGTVE